MEKAAPKDGPFERGSRKEPPWSGDRTRTDDTATDLGWGTDSWMPRRGWVGIGL